MDKTALIGSVLGGGYNNLTIGGILPAFDNNNIDLLFAASENYMPYFSTLLQSILEFSDNTHNYDIIIFHSNIKKESETIIQKQIKKYANFSIRFYNITDIMQNYKNLYVHGHFALETYFRLLAPYILRNYNKILYLDCDMLVQADVAKLYTTELTNEYLLAACKDADSAGLYNGNFMPTKKAYVDTVLKLKNYENYFQAGTILFNLQAFRESFTLEYIFEFALKEKWELLDQDILNCLAEDRVLYIDMAWNVMYDWNFIRIKEIISYAPEQLYTAYMQARENPYIIHYAGPNKPWEDKEVDFGKLWWRYAKKTPYFNQLKRDLKVRQTANKEKVTLKKVIKKMLMPFVNLFFPRGSKRREKLKKIFKK